MRTYMMIFLVICVIVCTSGVNAQNEITPQPLHTAFPGINTSLTDTSIFHPDPQTMLLGHQWGSARYRVINKALGCNFTNDHWSYLRHPGSSRTEKQGLLHRLDTSVTNYLGWALGEWTEGHSSAIQKLFTMRWLGYRYEPAENADPSDVWVPRDSLSWPYGFEYRHYGFIPTSPANENYRRFILHKDSVSGGDTATVVLDRCEPRTQTFNAHDPSGQSFSQVDSMSGRRMLLVVNLRLLDSTNSAHSDSPVLKLQVEGRRFEPDLTLPISLRAPAFFNFDSIPSPTLDSVQELPHSRGKVMRMVADTTKPTEVIIRRAQLPEGTGRDITFMAEFRTDAVVKWNADLGKYDTLATLKTSQYLPHGIPGQSAQFIDTLTPVISWYDTVSVAIRSVSIMPPGVFNVTCGWYDSLFAVAFAEERQLIEDAQDYWRDSVGSSQGLYVVHYYPVDEYMHYEDLGMYYRTQLLNGLVNSETGYDGRKSGINRVYTEGDGLKRAHMMNLDMYWSAWSELGSKLTRSPMIPNIHYSYEN